MKTKRISRVLTRALSVAALTAGLTLAGVTDATAHPGKGSKGSKRHKVHTTHVVYHHARKMPGWLKRHHEFGHWYRANHYRLRPGLSWNRLYDIYSFEQRYLLYGSRFYGRVVYDRGYRVYYGRPSQRR